jgi:quercetin dioxygenase-like cupin family protein
LGHLLTDGRSASAFLISWSEIPAEQVLPGIRRQVHHGQEQSVIRYVYDASSIFPVHMHPEEQMTMVLRGRIVFQVDDPASGPPREIELGPGQIVMLPGNVPHGARVIGSEEVETVNTLSPRRQDGPVFEHREQHP